MAIRKNKKRIDPRYFLHETACRDETEEEGKDEGKDELEEAGSFTTNMPDNIPTTAQLMKNMRNEPDEEQGRFSTSGPDPKDALSTDDLFKLFRAGFSAEDLRAVNNTNLTPEMSMALGR